jgi:hypothetical protein
MGRQEPFAITIPADPLASCAILSEGGHAA